MEISLVEKNGSAVVRSSEVASHFGKRHDHVLRDIDSIIRDIKSHPPKLGSEKFTETTFVNGRNREYREFTMNRDAFTLLAMGFTGKTSLLWKRKYIQAFNAMESALAEQSKGMMRALSEAVSAFESDKEKASQYGKALSEWKKVKETHIETIFQANKKAQMLIEF